MVSNLFPRSRRLLRITISNTLGRGADTQISVGVLQVSIKAGSALSDRYAQSTATASTCVTTRMPCTRRTTACANLAEVVGL